MRFYSCSDSLDEFDLPKLSQVDISQLTRIITSKITEAVLQNPNKEKPKTEWIHFTEEPTPILLKLFQERERERTLPKLIL
jgi:hypothetical protein